MLRSKFLDIIKTFSSDEFRRFRSFVRSPFHNTNKNVIKVVEIIRNLYPELNDTRLEKERIFMKIYPGKKYNDTVMRIILSDLLKLAEEYLTLINLANNTVQEKKFLLNELEKRKLDVLFKRHFKEAMNILNGSGLIDNTYFYDLFEMESKKIDFMISRGLQPESGLNVLKQGEHLINFFLVNILNIAHELISHKEVLNVDFDFNVVSEFLNNFNLKQFIRITGIRNYKYQSILLIYYYMLLSYMEPGNAEYFFELKKLFFNNINEFTREEKFNLFIILESICSSMIALGKREFYSHIMEIYETMLREKIYTHSEADYFQLNLFRNMFYTGIILKKFEWVEKFIEEHTGKLLPQYQDGIRHLAYAFIHFENKDFDKSLSEITQVKHNYFAFKFDVRVLMLKIYYEINSVESALALIDTFTHFLSNNKSSPEYYSGFYEFLKFTKQLIKLKAGSNKKDAGEIEKEISESKRVINRNWLLEKAGELK